ncbi:MAG: branched-chain amino acid ABC transporter permease [Proteobacteria bacterium]|nr:branched-chain amino acid ABC transporter permease [Desulfobacterales bacterium]MBU0732534.1 branched-chain amino acid ABC transporter permease [Pseudomonadota bacterium]MBU0990561.1 branched-chain amino acid ABC transporter permease [Pseudomonadota bacterium]MBU1903437.1 branched-chain amino acid ABC transporter permease [Pseudomonadota bacterium]
MLLSTLVYGFVNSIILALVALGFNLTFGISGVANFAYGAFYILAGFVAWVLFNSLGLPYILAVFFSVLLTAFAGALMYRFVLLRIRGMVLSEVIASFGIGLAILELFKYMGFIGFEYTLPVFVDFSIDIGQVTIDMQRIFIVIIGVGLTGFLWFFTHHTRTGLRFRGIAQDERTALSLGINSDRVAALSVSFGAAYAAIAAVVILPLGTITVEHGYDVLINALAVCIVGGLGSTGGVVIASFLIGYAETFTATYLGSHWVMLVPLAAILGILAIKPSGIYGKQKELEERI